MKKSSSKSFGLLFFLIFLGFAIWAYIKNQNLNYWFITASLVFLLLTLIKSKLLDVLNELWIKFGELLGRIVAPIVMLIIFFGVVFPIAILLKILKKDMLNLKYNKENTYWVNKEKIEDSMDKQF